MIGDVRHENGLARPYWARNVTSIQLLSDAGDAAAFDVSGMPQRSQPVISSVPRYTGASSERP
jgi:hypothetical protein